MHTETDIIMVTDIMVILLNIKNVNKDDNCVISRIQCHFFLEKKNEISLLKFSN